MPNTTPPDTNDALVGKKIALAAQNLQAGRLDQAESACRAAIRLRPRAAVAYQLLGLIAHRRGNYAAAIDQLQQSIELDPTQAPWHFNLGVSCRAADKLAQAQQAYTAAIAIDPHYAAAHHNLGSVLVDLGDLEAAFQSFRQTTRLDPNHANAHFQLGVLHRTRGDIGKSVRSYRKALALTPDDDEARLCLAVALSEFGEQNQAQDLLEPLCRERPGWAEAQTALASVLERLGHIDRAWRIIEPLLALNPVPVDAAIILADLAPKLDLNGRAVATLTAILDQDQLNDDQRMLCHYALGRLFDKQQHTDDAFKHFALANQLKPRDFDPAEHERFIDAMIEAFPPQPKFNVSTAAPPDTRPVFIVGMPRSGTSLVEQILASHPDVTGGGELPHISNLASQISKAIRCADPYPISVAGLTDDHLRELANIYLTRLNAISTEAKRITDKAPTNFLHLGLISRIFPHARIIHCQRTAAAACWSCFTQNFVGTHAYSYDLTHLGHYHRQYQRLMQHWHDVLTIPILDLAYEDLVTDPEPQMRRLIDFVGLDWHGDCLRFHENTRPMPSASYDQVRQPIYTAAIDRWRRYEQHLQPLYDALDRPAD